MEMGKMEEMKERERGSLPGHLGGQGEGLEIKLVGRHERKVTGEEVLV